MEFQVIKPSAAKAKVAITGATGSGENTHRHEHSDWYP